MTDDDTLFQQAMARHQAGDVTAAATRYRDLLTRHPQNPRLYSLLGSAEMALGGRDNALTYLTRALQLDPHQPDASYNRAILLQALQRWQEALAAFDHCLELNPGQVAAHDRRGAVLVALGRKIEALAAYRKAAQFAPQAPQAHYRVGVMALEVKLLEDALASFDTALRLAPNFLEALTNRATTLQRMGRYQKALDDFDRALTMAPDFATAHYNRGNLLKDMMRLTDARASLKRARDCDPNLAQAYWNEALVCLLMGNFEAGWPLYEWRWKNPELTHPDWLKTTALWRGEAIKDRTLIIRTDQGYGDYIQFCRFAITARARGARVILSAPQALCRLLRSFKNVTVVADGEALPADGLHVPVLSLPQLFAVTQETIPPAPYLAADPALREKIRATLGAKQRPRIGLAISGNANHQNDANRSIPLAALAPLLGLPCDFYLAQQGLRPADLAEAARWPNLHLPPLEDFADTAALIAEMDLTISVDSAPAHVAGAIGAPVWVLLPFSPDWRWLTERDDSPWYPTAKLYRQPAPGDWETVIRAATTGLSGYISASFT
ncbi:MAG: tetratricopeptide repeat protein [Rhizomicrobium sp.]